MGSYAGQRRQTSSVSGWIKFALVGVIISFSFQGALCEVEPTESQCRPYIEKALKEQHLELDEQIPEGELNKELLDDQEESRPTDELTDSTEGSISNEDESKDDDNEAEIRTENEEVGEENEDAKTEEEDETNEQGDGRREEKQGEEEGGEKDDEEIDGLEVESKEEVKEEQEQDGTKEEEEDTTEDQHDTAEDEKGSDAAATSEDDEGDDKDSTLEKPIDVEIHEVEMGSEDYSADENEQTEGKEDQTEEEKEDDAEKDKDEEVEGHKDEATNIDGEEEDTGKEKEEEKKEEAEENVEEIEEEKGEETEEERGEEAGEEKGVETEEGQGEETEEEKGEETEEEKDKDTEEEKGEAETEEEKDEDTEKEEKAEGAEEEEKEDEEGDKDATKADDEDEVKEKEGEDQEEEAGEGSKDKTDEEVEEIEKEEASQPEAEGEAEGEEDQERPEEEELIKEMVIPENLRPRDHIGKILKLEDSGVETILEKTIDTTLKALKGLYDTAIKPLEMLYKYRDLSNRHFGDPEIFSKPLILFMGPWSGGKSSTINYLLDNEFSHMSLRTGAEPSPAYFNILMYGEEEEILDGTQLAADWTFSGLQKFGQGLLDRLKGVKLPNKLLEKVNIVEIPGILEIRKQVQRLFPFNDACQWFIDRADIIFLVYDPSKLDVGPETEAILDQLKGREYQTRIILNKADQVKPEELMRVQGTLIWNISPLMSSSEPPIMYSTSLWSLPYEMGAPTRLLQAQERAFLRDLREAIDKRVENKISSARRFAVRVRNHAKMVDCYLTTYYNHKSIFGNRKKISDDIIEYPQKYHIYEGLSTLTNISRYDLPDPDVYRDFFKINPLYEFKKLSETCTYFRGCPINKLDVAIAYDLPELVGKYKKAVETAKEQLQKENS